MVQLFTIRHEQKGKNNRTLEKAVFWNYVSLIIMALSGLLINSIVSIHYNAGILGIYNETYAWYLLLSQISVWGIHMAIVKYVPEQEDEEKKGTLLKSAILLAIIISILTTIVASIVLAFLQIEWKRSLYVIICALLFFSINKVYLNYLNAINKMVLYAFLQSLRYIILVATVLILSLTNTDGGYLTLAFPITEIILFFVLSIVLWVKNKIRGSLNLSIMRELLSFGTRILPSNLVLEINSKVDLLCLGVLVRDTTTIGIYSFAIMFTDGFYQLYTVVRKIINPKLSENNAKGNLERYIKSLFSESRKKLILLSVLSYLMIILVYYVYSSMIVGKEYLFGMIYIAIIGLAIILTGKPSVLG